MPDYCTLWPDWVGDIYIGACCAKHDQDFETGVPFEIANMALKVCVERLDLPGLAALMFIGVSSWVGRIFYRRAQQKRAQNFLGP